MPTSEAPFKDISDTAFWVATLRAMESDRSDALFRDPYAELLSGDRGRRIVEHLGSGPRNSWLLVAKTCLLDGWIETLIDEEDIDTVVNLAAGLDTRAYRLDLPSTLRWVDVDLPEMIAYKSAKLEGRAPSCRLEYVTIDLSDRSEREALFAGIDASATRVLVISEGYLMYLTPESAASFAQDLSKFGSFRFWLADIFGPTQLRWITARYGKMLQRADSAMNFAPAEGADYFKPFGWQPLDFKCSLGEAVRLKRAPWLYSAFYGLRHVLPRSWFDQFTAAGIALWGNHAALPVVEPERRPPGS